MAGFEGKKSSIDIINNGTISDDGVVASDVPPRYLFQKNQKLHQKFHYARYLLLLNQKMTFDNVKYETLGANSMTDFTV